MIFTGISFLQRRFHGNTDQFLINVAMSGRHDAPLVSVDFDRRSAIRALDFVFRKENRADLICS